MEWLKKRFVQHHSLTKTATDQLTRSDHSHLNLLTVNNKQVVLYCPAEGLDYYLLQRRTIEYSDDNQLQGILFVKVW